MIDVPAIEIVAMLMLAAVVLRAVWLVTHQSAHHAALQPARWSREVDRVLVGRPARHRA